jgi:hypothetical protein
MFGGHQLLNNTNWYKVKLPITKYIPIVQHFQYFSRSLTKLSYFVSLDVQTRGLQCYFSVGSKGTMQKTNEEDE